MKTVEDDFMGRFLEDFRRVTSILLVLVMDGHQKILNHGGGECTFSDRERFFSFRREGQTGRMASVILLSERG